MKETLSSEKSSEKFDLVLGIDRSDKSFQACLLNRGGSSLTQAVSSAPEQMFAWWEELREANPGKRIAVAFEQPARNLVAFFGAVQVEAVFALNPSLTWAFRHSKKVSGARTDSSDAKDIATYVMIHQGELIPWREPDPTARQIRSFAQSRRKFVDQRTALTNRLQETLKSYYPQALGFLHEDIHRAINLAFLRNWATPQDLEKASENELIAFFHSRGSRSAKRMNERLEILRSLRPLTRDPAIVEPAAMEVLAIVDLIETQNKIVVQYDQTIETLFEGAGERVPIFQALPGAGVVMAPRVFAAFSINVEACKDSRDMAALSGAAPVTRQSGKTRTVHRRLQCDAFTRQTFHEWVKESWKFSKWAKAFVRYHQKNGKHFNTIMRMLALKWIRILYRLWQTRELYDEERYISNLIKRGHYLAPLLK